MKLEFVMLIGERYAVEFAGMMVWKMKWLDWDWSDDELACGLFDYLRGFL
jgi:hypothetical protein